MDVFPMRRDSRRRQGSKRKGGKKKRAPSPPSSSSGGSENYTYRLPQDFEDEEISSDGAFGSDDYANYGDLLEATGSRKFTRQSAQDTHRKGGKKKHAAREYTPMSDSCVECHSSDLEESGEQLVLLSAMLDSDDGKPAPAAKPTDTFSKLLPRHGRGSSTSSSCSDAASDDDDPSSASGSGAPLLERLEELEAREARREARKHVMTEAVPEGEFNVSKGAGAGAEGQVSVSALLSTLKESGEVKVSKEVENQLKSLDADTFKLAKPLSKPATARVERSVAYDESKREVSKWQPIVMKNRRAERLSFPLNASGRLTHTNAQRVTDFKPSTDMEQAIHGLLNNAKLTEDELAKAEQLEANTVDPKVAEERHAIIARMRSLMYHEERKNRRIKKIKSRAYRKIKSKEREQKRAMLLEELRKIDPEAALEQELKQERKRAEERMNLRHKHKSGWLKRQLRQKGPRATTTKEALQERNRLAQLLAEKMRSINGGAGDGNASDDEDDAFFKQAYAALDGAPGRDARSGSDSGTATPSDDEEDPDARAARIRKRKLRENIAALRAVQKSAPSEQDAAAASNNTLFGMKFMKDAMARKEAEANEAARLVLQDLEAQLAEEASSEYTSSYETSSDDEGANGSGKARKTKRKKKSGPSFDMIGGSQLLKQAGMSAGKLTRSSGPVSIKPTRKSRQAAMRMMDAAADAGPRTVSGDHVLNTRDTAAALASDDGEEDHDDGDQDDQEDQEDHADDASSDSPACDGSSSGGAPAGDNPWLTDINDVKRASRKNRTTSQVGKDLARARDAVRNAGLSSDADDSESSDSGAKAIARALAAKGAKKGAKKGDAKKGGSKKKKKKNEASFSLRGASKRQTELVARAFAGDNVTEEFAKEKDAFIREEHGEDIVDKALEEKKGWGSWTGMGVKPNRKRQAKRKRMLEQVAQRKRAKRMQRSDAKLKHVVISERRDKKLRNQYQVPQAPRKFESRDVYEQTIAQPLGQQWNTNKVHHDMVGERVEKKMGVIIKPMAMSKAMAKVQRELKKKREKRKKRKGLYAMRGRRTALED